jgi:hypothetical protein
MTVDTGAPPSIFLHTQKVYELMEQKAETRPVDDQHTELVYTGYLTKDVMGAPLNLPIPYYTKITRALVGMGCAQQIKRGGGSAPSHWALYRPPTLEAYETWERSELNPAKPTSKSAQLEQSVRDLQGRVDALEEAFQELLQAVAE